MAELLPQDRTLLIRAWRRLALAWVMAFAVSLGLGFVLMEGLRVRPETLLALSTHRLAAAASVLEKGRQLGVDAGLLLFFWNIAGALATLSFIYTADLIHPLRTNRFPRFIRKALAGRKPMKALCYLPGCGQFAEEPLRRLYVWLMVPLPGLLLLGGECGFIVSAVARLSGALSLGLFSLLPHGIIEIPSFALAGAIPFAAHKLVKKTSGQAPAPEVFEQVAAFRKRVPVRLLVLIVMLGLLMAGWVEGHVTPALMSLVKNHNTLN